MKKILLLFVFSICFSLYSQTQCTGLFNCNITPVAAANGKVIMYRKSLTGAMMDSINYLNVSSPTFTMVIPDSGRYILKFVPSSPLYQVSYSDIAKSWDQATVYNNPCFNTFNANFSAQPYGTLGGTGSGAISGKIKEGQKYGQKGTDVTVPGTPIGGIIVKGGKNPGGNFFAQTITNINGDYIFSNLPAGDYFIWVDIPGLDTASTHHVTLNNNQLTNLGFTVDSLKIVPAGNVSDPDVSVHELNQEKYSASIYPNPAATQAKLQYSLPAAASVKIEIFDLVGKVIKVIQPTISQPKGEYKQVISTVDLKSGVYFIRQMIDDQELIYKLVVARE